MEFNYFSENYLQFETDFLSVYDGTRPLATITDDLLKAMSIDRPYFIMPPQVTKDGRRYVFYFDVVGERYVYKECI